MLKEKLKGLILLGKVGIIGAILVATILGVPLIKNDFIITIDGKELSLDVDGVYADDALAALDKELPGVDYLIKEKINGKAFLADMGKVTVSTKKKVIVTIDENETTYHSYANQLQDFLADDSTELFKKVGLITLDKDEALVDGTAFEIKTLTEDLGVEYRENAELEKDLEQVVQEGTLKQTITLHQKGEAGKEAKLLLTKVLDEGQIKIIEKGTKKKASNAPAVPTDSVWDQLAYCESGGRWNVNTGNGYYGGLQFSAPTWNTASSAVGLDIAYASDATREEQILAASWLQGRSGWGQWPHCSSKLGLL